jgi:hypothetical protein
MTTDQRINKAIALVEQADDLCNQAKRLLHHTANYTRLASEDMTDAQYHLMDAVTHMQTRPLRRKVAKKLAVKQKMQYNVCQCCGAKDGRCGVMVNGECQNCKDTGNGAVVVHSYLKRTPEEIARMIAIKIDGKKLEKVS